MTTFVRPTILSADYFYLVRYISSDGHFSEVYLDCLVTAQEFSGITVLWLFPIGACYIDQHTRHRNSYKFKTLCQKLASVLVLPVAQTRNFKHNYVYKIFTSSQKTLKMTFLCPHHNMAGGHMEFTLSVHVRVCVCVFQFHVRPITSLCMVGFKKTFGTNDHQDNVLRIRTMSLGQRSRSQLAL